MLKETALNLFEAIPHFSLNIVDFAKGVGENFVTNIGHATLNIVSQIIFFVINLFIIPSLSILVVAKNADVNNLFEERYKAIGKGDKELEKDMTSKIGFFLKTYCIPAIVITSWTSKLITELIKIPILILSFNDHGSFACYVYKRHNFKDPKGIKGQLNFGYKYWGFPELNWKNPVKSLGIYLMRAVQVIIPLLFPIVTLYLLLPNTFFSVVLGLEQWTNLQFSTINFNLFTNMVLVLKDIVWDRLIMGAINENLLLFVIFIVVLAIYTDDDSELFLKVPATDKNGEETEDVRLKFDTQIYAWPMTAIVICLFNITLAMFSSDVYSTISHQINSAGMILLFVIIVKVIVNILKWCPSKLVEFVSALRG